MNVTIDERFADFIQERVASGQNADAADVIREALDQLNAADHALAALREAVALGDADFEAGRYTEYYPGLLEEILREAVSDVNARRADVARSAK